LKRDVTCNFTVAKTKGEMWEKKKMISEQGMGEHRGRGMGSSRRRARGELGLSGDKEK